MRILGIDPGIAIVGFGLIEANTFQQQRSVQINCSEIILRNLFRLKITDMPLNTFLLGAKKVCTAKNIWE